MLETSRLVPVRTLPVRVHNPAAYSQVSQRTLFGDGATGASAAPNRRVKVRIACGAKQCGEWGRGWVSSQIAQVPFSLIEDARGKEHICSDAKLNDVIQQSMSHARTVHVRAA